jgi:DNA-binding protein YbaB
MTMPAGFEALHELRGEAERMSRVLRTAENPAATHEGHDETESVHAVVDNDGAVIDFRLEREWYDKIDARRLGAAVLEAVNAAGVARLSDWAEKVAEAEESEPPASATPVAPAAQAEPFDLNPSGEMIDQLLYLLHRAGTEAQAEAKTAAAAAQAGRKPVKGRSEGGHVTVAMDGKQVVEVQIETDTRWIGTANNLEIVSELRSAFVAAHRAVADAAPRRRTDSAITELQALTADPQEFVAKLFGVRNLPGR